MKKILAENEGVSQLRKMKDFTAKDVCEQAKKGDPLAVKCVEFCMGVLGRAMAIFAHAFDPEVFVPGLRKSSTHLTSVLSCRPEHSCNVPPLFLW